MSKTRGWCCEMRETAGTLMVCISTIVITETVIIFRDVARTWHPVVLSACGEAFPAWH